MATRLDLYKTSNRLYAFVSSGTELIDDVNYSYKDNVSNEDIHYFNIEGQRVLESIISNSKPVIDDLHLFGKDLFFKLLPQNVKDKLYSKALEIETKVQQIKEKEDLSEEQKEKLLEKIDRSLQIHLKGQANSIPWELGLIKEDKLLGEIFQPGRTIEYASETGNTQAREIGPHIKVLIVSGETANLPNALKEVQAIYRALSDVDNIEVDMMYGPTCAILKKELPHYDILHFVGHAENNPEDKKKTGWQLNAEEWFSKDFIDRMSMDRPLPLLVFANACGSAQTSHDAIEEWDMEGMVVSFRKRGVKHFIGTLARIPDSQLSTNLAVSFYEELTQNNSIGQSLFNAKSKIAQHDKEGYFYAASYIHYGLPGTSPFGQLETIEEDDTANRISDITYSILEAVSAINKGETATAKKILEDLQVELVNDERTNEIFSKKILELQELLIQSEKAQNNTRELMKGNNPMHVGGKIGPYEITEIFTKSNYRMVMLADSFSDEKTPETQVVLSQTFNTNQQQIETQFKEFTILKEKLNHPGQVSIYDVCKEEKIFYTVHERVKGKAIKSIYSLNSTNNPEEEICSIIIKTAEALGAAHRQGIVHGELTPEDIYIDDKNNVKILNIGLFKILQRTTKRFAIKEAYIKYASPGQDIQKGAMTNPASDVWALGIIFYELLTGHHPFLDAEENESNEFDHLYPTLPGVYRADLSDKVAQLLVHIFTDPKKYTDASILANAIRRAVGESTKIGGFKPDLELAIETGAHILGVDAIDEIAIIENLNAIAENNNKSLYTWSVTKGLTSGIPDGTKKGIYQESPQSAIKWLFEQGSSTILVFLDFDVFLDDTHLAFWGETNSGIGTEGWRLMSFEAAPHPANFEDPESEINYYDDKTYSNSYNFVSDSDEEQKAFPKGALVQLIKDSKETLTNLAQKNIKHTIVMLVNAESVPEELKKTIRMFYPAPLSYVQIKEIILQYQLKETVSLDIFMDRFHWYSGGLTPTEIHYILELSIAKYGILEEHCLEELKTYKEKIIEKEGLLEIIHPSINLDDVIGSTELKSWIIFTKKYLDEAYHYPGTSLPKGILIHGLSGCGKSYVAKAIASYMEWPVVRLDMGRIFTGILGAAESNLRLALKLAQAISPVVLWIDDIDKTFSQTTVNSGGVNARLFNTLLTWLQEHNDLVYLIVTARDISLLPVEFTRAGRFDRIFKLAYLSNEEKISLVNYTFEKAGRTTDHLDLHAIVAQTNFYNNAEIVEAINESLFIAAASKRLNPTQEEVMAQMTKKTHLPASEVILLINDPANTKDEEYY